LGAGALKGGGAAAALGGIVGGMLALKMKTSIHSDADYRYGSFIPSSDTINIGLLQDQHLAFLAAGLIFLAGIILFASGAIIDAITALAAVSAPGLGSPAPVGFGEAAADPATDQPGIPVVGLSEAERAGGSPEYQLIVTVVVIGIVLLLLAAFWTRNTGLSGSSGDKARIEINADVLADNMEAQADNLDAIADTTGSTIEVAPAPPATANAKPAVTTMDEPR
jgi:hypothetical protein